MCSPFGCERVRADKTKSCGLFCWAIGELRELATRGGGAASFAELSPAKPKEAALGRREVASRSPNGPHSHGDGPAKGGSSRVTPAIDRPQDRSIEQSRSLAQTDGHCRRARQVQTIRPSASYSPLALRRHRSCVMDTWASLCTPALRRAGDTFFRAAIRDSPTNHAMPKKNSLRRQTGIQHLFTTAPTCSLDERLDEMSSLLVRRY
jgi:hypothetical protein